MAEDSHLESMYEDQSYLPEDAGDMYGQMHVCSECGEETDTINEHSICPECLEN
jgi:rubrerythrin